MTPLTLFIVFALALVVTAIVWPRGEPPHSTEPRDSRVRATQRLGSDYQGETWQGSTSSSS